MLTLLSSALRDAFDISLPHKQKGQRFSTTVAKRTRLVAQLNLMHATHTQQWMQDDPGHFSISSMAPKKCKQKIIFPAVFSLSDEKKMAVWNCTRRDTRDYNERLDSIYCADHTIVVYPSLGLRRAHIAYMWYSEIKSFLLQGRRHDLGCRLQETERKMAVARNRIHLSLLLFYNRIASILYSAMTSR